MESFNHKLKQITFKTFYRNQMATFDYDNLFANRRVLVFSITNSYTRCTGVQIKNFELNYQHLLNLGLDDIYVVDSVDWLVGPMMDKKKTDIKGLPDRDQSFIGAVSEYAGRTEDLKELSPWWQYMIIINNGEPEKLWSSPFKKNTSLYVRKNFDLRYRGLTVEQVEKYLLDNKQTNK
jgi:peroxiredoxin